MGRRASASKAGKGAKAGPQPAQLNTDLLPAADLQRRLESGNSLPEEEALQVLGHVPAACTNLYDKSCKSQRDNPDCFCGLLPQPEGFRKKGIWQREAQALAALGRDPAESCRKVCPQQFGSCSTPQASAATAHLRISTGSHVDYPPTSCRSAAVQQPVAPHQTHHAPPSQASPPMQYHEHACMLRLTHAWAVQHH